MLAHLIDLEGHHIRTLVAFGAGVGLAGRLDGELVPAVAGRAGAQAFVRVYAAHPVVGPAAELGKGHGAEIPRIAGGLPHHFHLGAVAVKTGIRLGLGRGLLYAQLEPFHRLHAVYLLGQVHKQGIVGQVPPGAGHEVLRILLRLLLMADRAIRRRDHHVHLMAVVVKGIGMGGRVRGMALGAAHGHV